MRTTIGNVGRRVAASAVSLTLIASAAVAVSQPGQAVAPAAARPPGSLCPAAYPMSKVHAGLLGTGWTTSRGRTPKPFAVRVLGVLRGGIAPGVDLILIRADSPAIRAAGIWQGMSGSPIYTRDGRLLGAVSYTLQGSPSPTAGVTPGAAMYQLLPGGRRAAQPRSFPDHIALTPGQRTALVRSGAASAAQAARGLRPLPTPVTVSGVPASSLPRIGKLLRERGLRSFSLHVGNSVSSGAIAPRGRARPGAPFAMAITTGDVTFAAGGTLTAVCDGRLLGFGHPFFLSGPSGATAQTATILYVQPEKLGPPFIQFNVGGRIGIVDQDRLVGVEGRLGATPRQLMTIVTNVSGDGRKRHGVTRTNIVDESAGAAANAIYAELIATAMKEGAGTVGMSWTATGHYGGGHPWRLHRADYISDQGDVEFFAADSVYNTIYTITSNPFAFARIDKLVITAHDSDVFRERTLAAVRVFRNGAWRLIGPNTTLPVQPGGTIRLQARLTAYRHTQPDLLVTLLVPVPGSASAGDGSLQVSGGADLVGSTDPVSGTRTFLGLLAKLRTAPTNASVVAQLTVPGAGGASRLVQRTATLRQPARGTVTASVSVTAGT
jgi:hypothetical protein